VSHRYLSIVRHDRSCMSELWGPYNEKGERNRERKFVARLNKTLYGLMQAAWEWNKKLHGAMVKMGYERVMVDHCIYIRTSSYRTPVVGIHVAPQSTLFHSLLG
jgi:hypothetical protein